MKTFIQLVNDAIEESGVDLDALSSGNFTNPPDKMHARFKKWVATAWKEIQLERNEWEFKSKRATINVSPRIYIEDGDMAAPPPVGSKFIGNDTGATFEVVGVDTIEGDWTLGTAKAFIDIKNIDGLYKLNEFFDEISPGTGIDVFRMKGWGRYDLRNLVSDLSEADTSTFYLQSSGGSTIQTNDPSADMAKLLYVPWPQWADYYEEAYGGFGTPQYFTTTPEGYFDFWPRMDEQYTLHFTYLAKPSSLVNETDTPSGIPEEYEDMIVWKAVIYYADYDRQFDVRNHATRRYFFYKNRMERNQMPPTYFGASKYD